MLALPARRPRRGAPVAAIGRTLAGAAIAAALVAPAWAPTLIAPAAASPGEDVATDGVVFAGVTGADPANLTTNPATLLRLEPGFHGFAIGTFALDQIKIQRRVVSADTGALAPGPTVEGSTFGVGVTGGIAYTRPRSMVAFAMSLRPPEETLDDEPLAYQTRGTRMRRIDWATLAVGFSLTSRLYLGLAGALADRYLRVRFARDTALDAGRDPGRGVTSVCDGALCGLENPAAREDWSIDATRPLFTPDNLVYTVGLVARLPGSVWLGLSIERPWQRGAFASTGDATIERAPRDGGATLVGDAVVIQHLPETVRAGGRVPIAPGWELTGELRWRVLARTDPMDVRVFGGELVGTDVPEWTLRPQGMHDAVAAEVGAEQIDLGQRLRLGARLGVDSGPVADDRLSARAPWGTQASIALGGQLRLDRWILQLGYRFDAQVPTTADPSAFDPVARLDCVSSDYNYDLPACSTVRAGYGTSTAAGDYSRFSHSARVVLRFVIP